jgi:beta-galactosidase
MMRAHSYQAVARGANSVMFFQWRQSKAGAEKYHSGMVPLVGAEESRIYQEVARLGAELQQLGGLLDTRVQAQVGLLFSYENVWALEIDSKPAQLDAASVILPWHDALATQNFPVDIVHPDGDFSSYRVLVAPLLYQLTRAQAEKLRQFVQAGGTLLMTYFSGITDDREHIWAGGYPALLQDVLGLAVEEWQPLMPDEEVQFLDATGAASTGQHWVDLLHPRSAEVLARYSGGFIDGRAALTHNHFGSGHAYYVGTRPEATALRDLLRRVCAEQSLYPLIDAPPGVEASLRADAAQQYLFVINHTAAQQPVSLRGRSGVDQLSGAHMPEQFSLEPFGVRVIRQAD